MRITKEFGSYNFRRYSKPWIARVTAWEVGQRPQLEFGSFLGTDDGGECEISAEPGDVVRWGQKDHRNPRGTVAAWAIVQHDGTIVDCTMSDARKAFDARGAALTAKIVPISKQA